MSPGGTVELQLREASGGQVGMHSVAEALSRLDFSAANPCTGSVFVEGVEPGDDLVVTFEEIAVDEPL